MESTTATAMFIAWATDAEPRLRQSLTATFGTQAGCDATADALGVAWERWDQISSMENPIGYVYGIGRNMARRTTKKREPVFLDAVEASLPDIEPGLPRAVAQLPDNQRIAVTLLHGYGWSMSEVAELLGIKKTTVQNHAERGMSKLRRSLGVTA